jgi:hypothetical protein
MNQLRQLTIVEQRAVTARLHWLTLDAPDLARSVRSGQYLLLRCAEAGSYDPLLRRPLFVAAAAAALGQIALLYEPAERGLAWLARGRAGDTLDVLGPFGQPFALDRRTRTLLLIGAGAGLPALLLLADAAAAQGVAVTLLAGGADAASLPPAYMLPGEVEYQTTPGAATDLLAGQQVVPPEQAGNANKRQRAAAARALADWLGRSDLRGIAGRPAPGARGSHSCRQIPLGARIRQRAARGAADLRRGRVRRVRHQAAQWYAHAV